MTPWCGRIRAHTHVLKSLKIFVSRSFDLIKGYWECEKHAVMFGCLCKALLRKEGGTHLQNRET